MNNDAKNQKSQFSQAEEEMVALWQKEKTFEKSVAQREGGERFNFNDGPPFANGLPHFGHSLVTGIKDSILRYKTMQGYYVPRRNGWDCHGLPVEYAIEKEFGVSGKKQILELGLEKFNAACRASIFTYKADWEDFLTRYGRWSDYEHYYATVDRDYTESVWWILSQINQKGLLYKGFKSLPYCPRCATPLSNFELNEGYKDDVPDPSVYVKFKLLEPETRSYLMGVDDLSDGLGQLDIDIAEKTSSGSFKITIPTIKLSEYEHLVSDALKPGFWNEYLNGDTVVFIFKDKEGKVSRYVLDDENHDELLALCNQYADANFKDINSMLVGNDWYADYPGLQPDFESSYLLAWTTTPWTLPANAALAVDQAADYAYVKLASDDSTLILAKERLDVLDLRKNDYRLLKSVKGKELLGLHYQPLYPLPEGKFTPEQVKNAHQVFHDDSVSLEDGTGVLHSAPRYGEADLGMGLSYDLPLIESVDSSGHLIYGPEAALGKFFKSADEPIIADLTHKGKIFAAETATHTYPFCWRCDTPLMYFATNTWFVEVTKVKDKMLKTAQDINWVPANIKAGRWGKWLEGARDWAISRNRYWGAPMPIWVNTEDENDYIVVESIAQLKELAGDDIKVDDLHRPFIDEISFTKDGKTYKRVEEVLDCWFESGSMPIAQWHYPFENKEKAEQLLTADFITEGLDQTRLWFYVQHVISTILFDQPAFKNVIVTGIINAADGQKLSKRLKNYPPVNDVFGHEGADAWRLYLLSSSQATETADYMRFRREAVTDLQRNVLGTLSNSFSFFNTYAKLDGWQPPKEFVRPDSPNLLDQWLLARLDETVVATTKSADAFKIAHAIEPVINLIDDLSNWYIRGCRSRFWKSDNDTDKEQAYNTLHYSLVTTCQLLAPWAPFISDHLWRQLVPGTNLPESVHLSDWPSVNKPDSASHKLLEDMTKVRELITEGLAQRAEAKIKVRQPLAKVSIGLEVERKDDFAEVIAKELNVKDVKWGQGEEAVKLDTELTPELRSEGVARDLIRSVQNARKNAGFNVEDRISLKITSDNSEITDAAAKFKDTINSETLATSELTGEGSHSETVKINGQEVTISVSMAK